MKNLRTSKLKKKMLKKARTKISKKKMKNMEKKTNKVIKPELDVSAKRSLPHESFGSKRYAV